MNNKAIWSLPLSYSNLFGHDIEKPQNRIFHNENYSNLDVNENKFKRLNEAKFTGNFSLSELVSEPIFSKIPENSYFFYFGYPSLTVNHFSFFKSSLTLSHNFGGTEESFSRSVKKLGEKNGYLRVDNEIDISFISFLTKKNIKEQQEFLSIKEYQSIAQSKYFWHIIPLKFDIITSKNFSSLRNAKYNDNPHSHSITKSPFYSSSARQVDFKTQFISELVGSDYNYNKLLIPQFHINSSKFNSFQMSILNQIYFIHIIESTTNNKISSDITQGVPLLRRYFDVPKNSILHLLLKKTFIKYYFTVFSYFSSFLFTNSTLTHKKQGINSTLSMGGSPISPNSLSGTERASGTVNHNSLSRFERENSRASEIEREFGEKKFREIKKKSENKFSSPQTAFPIFSDSKQTQLFPLVPVTMSQSLKSNSNPTTKELQSNSTTFHKTFSHSSTPVLAGRDTRNSLFNYGKSQKKKNFYSNLMYNWKFKIQMNLKLRRIILNSSLVKILQKIVNNVQAVYCGQGVEIYDQHVEIIVRQMGSKVRVKESPVYSRFFWNEIIPSNLLKETTNGEFEPTISGITKISLQTDSFLSAASFQSSVKILTQTSLKNSTDFLLGLKENVIVNELIPSGTGFFFKYNKTINPYLYPDIFEEEIMQNFDFELRNNPNARLLMHQGPVKFDDEKNQITENIEKK